MVTKNHSALEPSFNEFIQPYNYQLHIAANLFISKNYCNR